MAFAISSFCLHLCLTLLQESIGDKIQFINKIVGEHCLYVCLQHIIVLKLLAIGKQTSTTMKKVVSCWCHHNTRRLNTELPLEQTLPCADSL